MSFGEDVTPALTLYDKRVDYTLEFKTNFPEGSTWQAYAFADFTLTRDAGTGAVSPSVLRVAVPNDAFALSDERDPANRVCLFAQARLTVSIGQQSEVLFYGRVYRVEPEDYSFTVYAQDWLALVHECECEVQLAPDETDELAVRALSLVAGGAFGSVYGFTYDGSGSDPAFNAAPNPGTRRRSWAPGNVRLYYDAGAQSEVPPQHYLPNLTSGTVSILEDTAGLSYYAGGVRCYIEGTRDWADVFRAALAYPKGQGGIGASDGELDLPPTLVDLAGPVYFRGLAGDLLSQILSRQQQNLRLWFDSATGKYTLRVIVQKAVGEEDYALIHAASIAQPRELRDVFSRVVVTGLAERPRNALTLSTTALTDITTQGDWFAWDGLNVGPDSTFAAVSPLLYDGDACRGASVHNLAASEGGGTDKYNSWYSFVKIDFGSPQRISRVRLTTPGSRNLNAAAGHQGAFWPGVQILASLDDADYRLLAATLYGRFPPHERVEARGAELLNPRARYVKVLLGAYKHGFENSADPSIGLAELEIYLNEEYRVAKEIDGAPSPPTYYDYTADYDRDGETDRWQRNHPGLWTRLGGRHRTRLDDQAGELNEYLAHDRAVDLLAESVRLFEQVHYRSVCDPRVRLYDTVVVDDELNGGAWSILVERVVLRPSGTEISGTNYRSPDL